MKKLIALLAVAFAVISCSNNKPMTISIDDVRWQNPSGITSKQEDYKDVTSIFTVVPGKYEVSIEKFNIGFDFACARMPIKLRLNKKTQLIDAESFALEYMFYFTDSEGNIIRYTTTGMRLCCADPALYKKHKDVKHLFNEDELQDLIDFFASEPGTEKEFMLGAASSPEELAHIKEAKGLVFCAPAFWFNDRHHEDCFKFIE